MNGRQPELFKNVGLHFVTHPSLLFIDTLQVFSVVRVSVVLTFLGVLTKRASRGSCLSRIDLSAVRSSVRDAASWGWLPRPAGSLTVGAFYSSGSVPLQVSRLRCCLSCSSVSPSVLSLPSLPQLGPRALPAVGPFHHSVVLPNPDKGHFYSVDSFIRQFIARQCSHPNHAHTELNHLLDRSHPSVAI